jgi:hypothetical protein
MVGPRTSAMIHKFEWHVKGYNGPESDRKRQTAREQGQRRNNKRDFQIHIQLLYEKGRRSVSTQLGCVSVQCTYLS